MQWNFILCAKTHTDSSDTRCKFIHSSCSNTNSNSLAKSAWNWNLEAMTLHRQFDSSSSAEGMSVKMSAQFHHCHWRRGQYCAVISGGCPGTAIGTDTPGEMRPVEEQGFWEVSGCSAGQGITHLLRTASYAAVWQEPAICRCAEPDQCNGHSYSHSVTLSAAVEIMSIRCLNPEICTLHCTHKLLNVCG